MAKSKCENKAKAMKCLKQLKWSMSLSFILASSVIGASFEGLGGFPSDNFSSYAQGISDDGSVVIGNSTADDVEQAFRWTKSAGMVSLGNLPGSSFRDSWTNDVSSDGSVIVGYGDPSGNGWDNYQGYQWTQNTGMQLVGSLNDAARYMAFGVSADGSVIVGDGGSQAFRWTQNGGIQGLGVLPGLSRSRAVDVSADGSVAVGSSFNSSGTQEQAFRWTQNDGMQGLGYLPGGNISFAIAISPEGSTIVGTALSSSTYPGFYWKESTGMVSIGHLSGMNTTHPMDVSLNGEIIVGGSFNSPTVSQAFIWDEVHGMRSLKRVLVYEYGLDLTGWTLQAASGITPDGSVIVGWGINPSGQTEAFRVVLNVPEPATVLLLAFGGFCVLGQRCEKKHKESKK